MDGNGIVPDIIAEAPKELAKITYPSGVVVDLGKELTPTQVKDQPEIQWKADSNGLYTLLMVDPDAPSRENPTLRSVCHWLVVNIPGDKVSAGQTIADYKGSAPPEGCGLHRYIFLIFKQKESIVNSSVERLKFNLGDYISKQNLGVPVAGNYYQAQYDDYVPILMSKINKK